MANIKYYTKFKYLLLLFEEKLILVGNECKEQIATYSREGLSDTRVNDPHVTQSNSTLVLTYL